METQFTLGFGSVQAKIVGNTLILCTALETVSPTVAVMPETTAVVMLEMMAEVSEVSEVSEVMEAMEVTVVTTVVTIIWCGLQTATFLCQV